MHGQSSLPGNPNSVSVMMFKNRSSHIGAETAFTTALIDELMRISDVSISRFSQSQESSGDGTDLAKNDADLKSNKRDRKGSSKRQKYSGNQSVDAIIYGEIVNINFGALSRTADDAVYERTVTAVVNLKMKSSDGDTLFAVNHFSESDRYYVPEGNEADETAKKEVVEKVFHRMAQRIVSRMADNF
ncbi:LPS assembly lipoprotein LptE [Desulfamplus magnetovallimortis]|uniref:LPS assembly lipoprotein LptE n=1 Tax=Desulfamplus magnetovallimortis TaxID=1246637 RepID=UPI001647DDCD|nr:LPS assembly lipoprotein LptE [Desulfamplus magnetovallimortis]